MIDTDKNLDFPLTLLTYAHGFSQASRGLNLYRKIEGIEKELNMSEFKKFSSYLDNLKPIAVGFIPTMQNDLPSSNRAKIDRDVNRIVGEMFSANNRSAIVHRNTKKDKVNIADIRRTIDGEVKFIRSQLNGDMLKVYDRSLELPEEQIMELVLSNKEMQLDE